MTTNPFTRYTDDPGFADLCQRTLSLLSQLGRMGAIRQDLVMAWKRAAHPEQFEKGPPAPKAISRPDPEPAPKEEKRRLKLRAR